MDDLLKYEAQVQTILQEGNSPGALPFPNGLESESPEAELWSRVHLSYVTSLNLGGYNTAAAIAQWADIRSGLLMEYVPKKTWSFSQAELKGLEQKLTLGIQSCQYELDVQLSHTNEVVTPLTLFCRALLYCVCKDKELFDEKLLPNEVTWQGFVQNTYSPIWKTEIEFVCTKVTNENLLPMGLHVLSAVIVMHQQFVKLSTNQVTAQKDSLSWLYEPQQLRTISSCCEDAVLTYFDDTYKSRLCEDLDQMLSIEKLSSITQRVDNCVDGAKVVIQSCWRLCNDIDHVILILNGRCPLTERLQPLCADAIDRTTSACLQKFSEAIYGMDLFTYLVALSPDQCTQVYNGVTEWTLLGERCRLLAGSGRLLVSKWCSTDAPQRLPYRSWYIILSSLLHMAGRLRHHVTHNYANCLATPLEQCSKLVDWIQSDIVNYHIELCRNGLLHDGRSHHWQDSRPFYEGERCSFAVQMWSYHLKAFKHDLWQVFAYDVAAKLLAAVLAEGLIILSQRYSSVKPSMRRLPQMKADILMVLLTSASLLPHLFSLPCLHDHRLYVTSCVINSCCMSLLCDLILVCADLRTVMDCVMENTMTTNGLRRGFNDCNSQWLSHVLFHCHVHLPPTYHMGPLSSTADAANSLLYLCGLSTMNEQSLIKVLLVNNFLLSKALVKGGAGVVPELAHILCCCSHAPYGLCVVLEEAGNKECTDWLISYLQPHLLWCMLPKAVLFTRWMAKFLHSEVNNNDRKALVEIFSEVLKQICDLLQLLPSPVCLLISRLSPVSTLLGRLLRSTFPQPHNQLFYHFVSIAAGLLDGSMLFEAPASITDLLSSCKADFTPIIATMNDTPLTVNGICNDSVSDDSQHRIVGKLLKETSNGRKCLRILFDTIVSNQDALLQWCKKEGVDCEPLTLSAPPTCADMQPFCPTKEFCRIGQVTLDHMALLKASLDWPDLLSAVWPHLSQEMLIDRLGNRWEFQEEAWLNDEESQLVDAIKKRLC